MAQARLNGSQHALYCGVSGGKRRSVSLLPRPVPLHVRDGGLQGLEKGIVLLGHYVRRPVPS